MPGPSQPSEMPSEDRPPPGADGELASQLRERIKELSCLLEVAAAFARCRGSLREGLEKIVAVLPGACREPERACASLRLDDLTLTSPDRADRARDPRARIACDLRVAGVRRGGIELAYEAASSESEPGEAFLPEERALLEAVASQIGTFVESIEAERRRSSMESQLRHADRLATIGQLAAGVAHELNEPLGNTLGFAQLALKSPGLPEQVRADLGRIVQAALHGREIIRKLLVFARQAPASKQRTAINGVVEEAMFLLEAGCENPGVRFERDLDEGLPEIEADPVQVRQVITNLVINAIQSIPGKGTVRVRSRAEGGDVVLTIEDDGAGMTPEVRQRAFDPFFTTKDVGEGTGLGLAVVQGIVAGHGGTIEVESAPARGSTFRVRLPVRSAPVP
ncbi:MAG: PAS domain-containing sensor histidine kinase [Phycisphaerales bacterium]|nr:PAS domain-containing sensor histidine kinase [Phycisphaerales bacterium]